MLSRALLYLVVLVGLGVLILVRGIIGPREEASPT